MTFRRKIDRLAMGMVLATASCLVAACGQGENDPGPGGVTVGEARALDEAAQMLEDRRLPPEDLRTAVPAPAPAATSSLGAPPR